MRVQSGQAVTIDILGSIQQLVWDVAKFGLQLLGFLAFVVASPVLYFFFGLLCARSGSAALAMVYVLTSPLPVAVWTLFICRWRKIRQWRRAGKDLGVMGSNWRESEGGWVASILKSFGIMFLAGFSSFVAQMGAVAVWVHLMGRKAFFAPIYMIDRTPHDIAAFWSFMPFVAFSPVIVLLISGWIRRDRYAAN